MENHKALGRFCTEIFFEMALNSHSTLDTETKTHIWFIICGVYIGNITKKIIVGRSIFKGKALVLKQKTDETYICKF